MSLYRTFLRPLLFTFNPETAHNLALWLLRHLPNINPYAFARSPDEDLSVEVMGIDFPSPVGLGAGFDKNARAVEGLSNLGFGFIEIGTVTPRPQEGHDRPRLHRIPGRRALVNRMGFPNAGQRTVSGNLRDHLPLDIPIGVNVGPNRDTAPESVWKDCISVYRQFKGMADYLTINVSSPNTEGLRSLQHQGIGLTMKRIQTVVDGDLPIVVKLSPDMDDYQLKTCIDEIEPMIDGLVVANTSDRHGHRQKGGISGKPLTRRSLWKIKKASDFTDLPIIASGGIMSGEDARRAVEYGGADLVQLWTGLVYEGPGLIRQVESALDD